MPVAAASSTSGPWPSEPLSCEDGCDILSQACQALSCMWSFCCRASPARAMKPPESLQVAQRLSASNKRATGAKLRSERMCNEGAPCFWVRRALEAGSSVSPHLAADTSLSDRLSRGLAARWDGPPSSPAMCQVSALPRPLFESCGHVK